MRCLGKSGLTLGILLVLSLLAGCGAPAVTNSPLPAVTPTVGTVTPTAPAATNTPVSTATAIPASPTPAPTPISF